MFTVCPKCALTLVVTAADLRVAQGYVRCGRCSNVFNALARLSEDRQSATAAAQAQTPPEPTPPPAPKPAPPPQQRTDTSATYSSATARSRALPDPSATARTRQAPDLSASAKFRQPAAPPVPAPPPPSSEPKRYDDDTVIPEEDLEFNPDSTDLNKVFVEQPPSPQFTAATGTFKAIRLEAQDPARSASTDEREIPQEQPFDPVDTQVDVEIDPDLLATMAQLTSNRLERLNPTLPEPEARRPSQSSSTPLHTHSHPSSHAPTQPPSQAPTSSTGTHRALQPPKAPTPAKQVLQPPVEQPPQTPASTPLAKRAKARAEAAADTTQALKAALAPRKRNPVADLSLGSTEQPTPFFAGMWAAGSLLLLLVLTVQIVHHYRHDLAANATLNGPLTSIYAVLGIPIVPRWNLGAYEVRQLGASTAADAPGQITVRASVKNNARQAQPLPLLRVTLQDRFGNRIASRDVPPQSYLPRAIPSSSLLSAGQRIDAEVAFVDPGSNAVGFEIDACLPAPGGGISCANDAAR